MSQATLAGRKPSLWRRLRSAAADLIYPPQCTSCAAEMQDAAGGVLLCPACIAALMPSVTRCPACASPSSAVPAADGRCASCRTDRPAFAAARVLGNYQDRVRDAVLKIKHDWYEPLAVSLGRLLARRIKEMPLPSRPDFVVPVPMHWLRRLWRGTSAARTLAETLSSELGWPVANNVVICQRMMAKQSSLPASERKENVRGAYRVSRRRRDFPGATILVVDDVITTAATCDEVARVLLRAGAEQVFAAAVARTGS